ncbi:hypothetical protein Ddc_13923 [Ditylenchus destructor]|nr:hypothetical protein Ddc_13923 [Ditylenchus destructor]
MPDGHTAGEEMFMFVCGVTGFVAGVGLATPVIAGAGVVATIGGVLGTCISVGPYTAGIGYYAGRFMCWMCRDTPRDTFEPFDPNAYNNSVPNYWVCSHGRDIKICGPCNAPRRW